MTFTSTEPVFILDKEEVKQLQKFLFSVGYISYDEFESIHSLAKKIDEWLKAEANHVRLE